MLFHDSRHIFCVYCISRTFVTCGCCGVGGGGGCCCCCCVELADFCASRDCDCGWMVCVLAADKRDDDMVSAVSDKLVANALVAFDDVSHLSGAFD